jgi:polyphosphate:AMP phosphotransferase
MGHPRVSKREFERELIVLRDQLLAAQSQLETSRAFGFVLILTGAPTAGRSEVINDLLEWLDPKFIHVHAFGPPDAYDQLRPEMWRYWTHLPARGRMAFMHTGWYSELHQLALEKQKGSELKRASERIRQLEAMLEADGIRVLKVQLDLPAKLQRERLATLRADKLTRWRVTTEDRWLVKHHRAAKAATEVVIELTESANAPWHRVDAADEEYRLLRVGNLLLKELQAGLAPQRPKLLKWPKHEGGKRVRLPARALPALNDDDYERELNELQSKIALAARRAKFRKHALVLAFEGMDAAGKGGSIRRVTRALDARQYQVVPVSAPTPEEAAHPYLWRFWNAIPPRGEVTIYDRSWYGRVLVERVRELTPENDWQRAYDEINEFELQLSEHRIIVAKFWLSVSKEEQFRRLKAREDDPLKRFKVDKEDWANRRFYEAYQTAAAEMIRRTNTQCAPWFAIEADDKPAARIAVLRAIASRLDAVLK